MVGNALLAFLYWSNQPPFNFSESHSCLPVVSWTNYITCIFSGNVLFKVLTGSDILWNIFIWDFTAVKDRGKKSKSTNTLRGNRMLTRTDPTRNKHVTWWKSSTGPHPNEWNHVCTRRMCYCPSTVYFILTSRGFSRQKQQQLQCVHKKKKKKNHQSPLDRKEKKTTTQKTKPKESIKHSK